MQNRYLYALRIILFVSDLILIFGSFITATKLANLLGKGLREEQEPHYLIFAFISWLVCANVFRLYSTKTLGFSESLYRGTWKCTTLHLILFIVYLFVSKDDQVSRTFVAIFYFALTVSLFISRFVSTGFELKLLLKYRMRRPVALLGKNATSLRLASYFEKNQKVFDFGGFLNDDNELLVDPTGNILKRTCDQIKGAAEKGIKEIYVSLTADRVNELGSLMQEADRHCIHLKLLPDLSQIILPTFTLHHLGGLPIVTLRSEPLEEIRNRFRKRLFDIVFSLSVILFILTWFYPIIAILIRLDSPGPPLFKQLRSGKDNKTFWCYKFRSMRMNVESENMQASKYDQRITILGRFLRRTSLDELPQFLNVFLGNMSVVGPRPHMLKQTEQYRSIIHRYMVRHNLKPGITGWAQINGFRGETSTVQLMERRIEHDIWYLENWSLMLDFKIIVMTIINVFRGDKNAY